MNDHDFILSLQSQINAHLGTNPPVDPPPKPVDPPPTGPYAPRTFGGPSFAHREYFEAGTVYAYTIPSPHGLVSLSNVPGGDGNNSLDISISATPGDMSKTTKPCGGTFGVESAGLRWSNVAGDASRCVCAGFINIRMRGISGSLDVVWNPY